MSSTTANEIQSFDTYPPISQLIRTVPGVEYLYTPAQEVNKAQRDGWQPLRQPVYFDICDTPFTILARGKVIEGVTPESCQPKIYSTSTGDEQIGYVRKADAKKSPK